MGTQTEEAHCGACAGCMTLDNERPIDDERGHAVLYRYVCHSCGYATPWQTTVKAAAEDVVWVTLAQAAVYAAGAARPVG